MCLLPENGQLLELSLTRALHLAEEAAAFASPNPTVGCVLAKGETLLGEGAHFYDARDHAEIAALKMAAAAGHNVRGATAFVTLEPCSHHGRTGPCAGALIAAGITHCVIATLDPNPLVRGEGIAMLQAAGVAVHLLDPTSPLAQKARRLNDAFAFSIQHHRPLVRLKAALSLDGKSAPPPHTRTAQEPFWLTGPAARADVAHLRHGTDALLTGIGTVLADNPHLTDRTGLPRRRSLLRVVFDSNLRIPANSHLVQEAEDDLLIICSESASHAPRQELSSFKLEIHPVPGLGTQESLSEVLHVLHHRGLRSVLLEAGPTLNGAFLRAGLVDGVILYYADRELGSHALPFATNYPSPYLLQENLTFTTRQTFPNGPTEDVRITGYLHDPWKGL